MASMTLKLWNNSNSANSLNFSKQIAQSFKNYFSFVASNVENTILYPINCSFSNYLGSPETNVFSANPSHPPEVKKVILDSKNKSYLMNEIPFYIYRKITESLSQIDSDWFNKSVTICKLPSYLKTARIVPVFKGGDKTVVKNYLTIYRGSFITKVFDKLI